MNRKSNETHIGGQAVIEGVMMRGPKGYSIAVRNPSGEICLKTVHSIPLTKRNRFLGLPLIRGGVSLMEMLVIGIKSLNHSANVAMEEENADKTQQKKSSALSSLSMAGIIVFAFALAIVMFIVIPSLATHFLGNLGVVGRVLGNSAEGGNPFNEETSPLIYNAIAGVFRVMIFMGYVVTISFMKDIKRLFQYHGAEHKSIFAFENGKPLTCEEAKHFTTLHPRCGTSFVFVVMMIAIVVFSIVPKILLVVNPGFMDLPFAARKGIIFFLHILFMPIIAGIGYEIIKLASKYPNVKILRLFILPGMLFQKITTREPDEDQIQVAIEALKAVLIL